MELGIEPPSESAEPIGQRDWERTGVWHTEPCGCVHDQKIETGGDYHERWVRILTCPKHGPIGRGDG